MREKFHFSQFQKSYHSLFALSAFLPEVCYVHCSGIISSVLSARFQFICILQFSQGRSVKFLGSRLFSISRMCPRVPLSSVHDLTTSKQDKDRSALFPATRYRTSKTRQYVKKETKSRRIAAVSLGSFCFLGYFNFFAFK